MSTYIVNNAGKQNKVLIGMIILFSALLGIRDIGEIAVTKYIFVVLVGSFFLAMKPETLIASLCFFMPLFNGLPGNYIIFLWIIVFTIRTKIVKKRVMILFVVYVLAEMISNIGLTESSIVDILSYLACLYLLFLMLHEESSRLDRIKCLECYFFGVFLFCIITLFSTLAYAPSNWLELFSKGWYRFGSLVGVNTMHIGTNANELAYYALVGFCVGLVLLTIETTNMIRRYILFAMDLSIVLIGALSTSRSYILILTLIVCLYFLISKKSIKGILVIGAAIVLIVGVISYINFAYPEFLEGFTARFTDSSTMSTGGGRTTLLHDYWNVFFSKLRFIFLGTGVVGYKEATGLYHATHNMLQQIIMCYGIPLGIVFLLVLLRPIIKYFCRINSKVLVLPIVAVVLFTQTIQFLNPWSLMLHFIIGIFTIQIEALSYSEKTLIDRK